MRTRRGTIISSAAFLVIGLLLVASYLLERDSSKPLAVSWALMTALQLPNLVIAVRNRPMPPLTAELFRAHARRSACALFVIAAAAATMVLVWRSSVDPDRRVYLLWGVGLTLTGVAQAWTTIQLFRGVRRGEVPERFGRQYAARSRRRARWAAEA